MVDIERSQHKKGRGINLLNHLFKRRSKRNLNEMVRCLSSNSNESNDKLDQLLSKSSTNVNDEMGTANDNSDDEGNQSCDVLKETKLNQQNRREAQPSNQLELSQMNEEVKRRLSTPIIAPNANGTQERKVTGKKLSLKARRSFSPKSKLIINQGAANQKKKMSLDQQLLEHYNQLSTECNSSYLSLVSNSPISPRIKSIDEDVEALTLSRQDNPYIQNKLEKLSHYSGGNHDILSIFNLSLNGGNSNFVNSTNTLNNLNQSGPANQLGQQANQTPSISSEELDEILNFGNRSNKDDNLHQHLIRSPPPDFPVNFSSFIYPPIGSPLRSLSTKYNNSINSSSDTPNSVKTPNLFLSPLKRQSRTSTQSPKKDNLFFANLTRNKLKNLTKSGDGQLANENDVELIITG